jgi:hypothetical protein
MHCGKWFLDAKDNLMNQLTKGQKKRLMYIENKDDLMDGKQARIGWVTFSKSGLSIYYRNHRFSKLKGERYDANYFCEETNDAYWISGVKKRGSNVHWNDALHVHIDEDAIEAYQDIKGR